MVNNNSAKIKKKKQYSAQGLFTSALSQPADVLKTRCQADPRHYTGPWSALRTTVREDGLGALWKGFLPRYVRLGPHTVLLLVFYEQLRQRFGVVRSTS